MTTTKIIWISLAIGLLLTLFGGCSWWVSINKEEAQLRLQVEAQQTVCKSHFDKMWKILQDQTGVTESYKDSFKEIYTNIMDERYDGKPQLLMQWVTESNPNFDVRLFERLMESISVERNSYHQAQSRLTDMNRQHLFMISPNNIPTYWFLRNTTPINVVIVTSSRTEKAYETGQDNETLFSRPSQKK